MASATKTPKKGHDFSDGFFSRGERGDREIAWERYTTVPLIFMSFLFILSFSILILDDLKFFAPIEKVLIGIILFVWATFWIDFCVRFTLSPNRKSFFRHNLIDLFSLIVPFARPFLLLMYLARLPYFRGRNGSSLRARVVAYLVTFSIMYVYVISLFVYQSERNAPGATITSYGDAVWWAMETISTVGYGDMIPVTVVGRLYASLLMLGAMIIVGATTGTVVSYLGERVQVLHKRKVEHDQAHANDIDSDSSH
jgi:voltage-gated potassium channel